MIMENVVIEPAVNKRTKRSSDLFNPNVPFEVTQEEFIAHIRRIEDGNFTPWEEFNKKHEAWKKEYLANASSFDPWNPNVPMNCTQEEFLEHIHSIEAGEFETWEEHQNRFNAWKTELLASRM